jgi:cytochrome c biogenesis protein CcmG/thiol:disulfide interchange protein DsbE
LPSTRSSSPSEAVDADAPLPSRRARLVVAIVAVVVVLTVVAVTVALVTGDDGGSSGVGLAPGAEANSAGVGEPAPDFTLPGLDGGTVRLSDYRGTPVVLNFWASWCTPCRKEFPLFRETRAAKDGKFAMVGVSTGDLRGDAEQFADEEHADWPNGFDADNSVALGYGVDPLPQTFFIRADGTVASHVVRGLNRAELRRELRKIGVD